jgi:parallel beta-helix repeat protein
MEPKSRASKAVSLLAFLAVLIAPALAQTPISSCTDITSSGYYYLTQNLTGFKSDALYCIWISASNVVLDGNGYSLTGPGDGYGISVANAYITVKNLTVSNYYCGIKINYLENNNTVANVTASNNDIGIWLEVYSYNNIIKDSVLQNNNEGIYLGFSGNNLIYNNYFNNTNNIGIVNSRPNTWNITKTEGKNIVGGNFLGGNYWGRPDGNGFSDTCNDSNYDGFCDEPYVIDSNNIDYLPLTRTMLFIPSIVVVKVQYLDTGATSYYSIPITLYLSQDRVYNVSASLDISGVNPSYGANITVELLSKVALTDMSYNGSSVSYTYLGQNTSNSRVYSVYNFTTTANGTLIVNGTYANRAWDTVVKIDKKVEQIPTLTAVLGESVEIVLPARGNITLPSGTVLTNVTSFNFNTRGFGVGNLLFILGIDVPESDDYGQLTVSINTVYANRTVTVLDKDGEIVSGVGIYAYNIDANKTTPASTIEAGNNSIQIFFRDMKLAETPVFYVNHTNISDSLTVSVLSKLLPTDYKNASKRVYAQKDFNLTVLDAKVSRFAINLTEPSYIYIDFARNLSRPLLILSNCSLVSYAFPYAKLYCSGNATVAEGYTITLQVKDALGRPIDIVFALDNESLSSNRGIATIIRPVGNYSLTLPAESLGFRLKTNATYSITLENDTSITAVYKVPTRIESREVRIEKRFPFPFPFLPFETQETDNAGSVAKFKLEGSVIDYFGAPVPNRNIIIEIKAVGGATTYANTTTDSSGNFVAQANFTTNTTYMITYTLPEDDIYVGTSSVKTLTFEAIAPPPAPSPIGVTIPITVIVAVIALATIIAVVAIAKSVRRKTAEHMLGDMSEFRFFRRVR